MKPKSTKRKKLAEASPEPGVVLVKQTKEYKEKRGKKENTKTKTTKKKKTNVKKSKGHKEKKAKTKFGIGGSSKGKKIVKKHGKEKKKPSKNVEQIRPQKPRELPAQPLKIEGSSKKSLSKQRKIKKPLVNEKDRKPETHTERKKRREKKGLKEERKTTIRQAGSDKKHWIEEEFLEPGKKEKGKKKKTESPSAPPVPPVVVEEPKKSARESDRAKSPTYPALPPTAKEFDEQDKSLTYPPLPPPQTQKTESPAKSSLTYPMISTTKTKTETMSTKPIAQPKKDTKPIIGELYGVQPEKPEPAQSAAVRMPSPPIQPTQREDIVPADHVKTTLLKVSPKKEAVAPQKSAAHQRATRGMPSSSPSPSRTPYPGATPTYTSTLTPTSVTSSQPRPLLPVAQVDQLPMPQPPSVQPPTPSHPPVPEALRVNVDEILRLGAIMERRGLSTDKKMSFEWIALNRHVIYQLPEAFASHLITAVGDVRLERSLACDALNVLMYQHTITPDEYLRLCQILENPQPITIGILTQLVRTNTHFYSNRHKMSQHS